MDVAVTELDLRCVDRCAIYFHCLISAAHCGARGFGVRFQRVVISAELFILLARYNTLLDECSITLDLCAPNSHGRSHAQGSLRLVSWRRCLWRDWPVPV